MYEMLYNQFNLTKETVSIALVFKYKDTANLYIGFRWKTNCITLPLIVTELFVKLFIYFNWFSDLICS